MKKRALSLLMALCLLLGLIPAVTAPAAAAADSACIVHVYNMNTNPTEEDFPDDQPRFFVGGNWCVVFYTNDNGTPGKVLETPTFSVTSGSPELEIIELDTDRYTSDKGHTIYEITPQEFGSGTLEITSGGVTYSMDYTVELPVVGFYDSTTRSEDSFLQDYTFRYDDDSRTFYYLVDPNSSMTVSNPCVDRADNGGDPTDVKVTLVNSTTVKITLPVNQAPEGEYRLRYTITEGSESWEDWLWFNLQNNAPAVRYREVYYDNDQAFEEGPFRTVLDIPAIYSRSVTFYYGTAESATPLRNYKVTVDDPDLAEIRLRSDRPLADGRKPCQLNGTGIGSTTLTFELDAGPVYTMPLNVELPEFGRYDEQEFSEDALIWDDVYDSTEDTVFWLMTEEGFENPRMEELEFQKGDAKIDFVQRGTSDFYDVRVTIPKDTRGGVEFFLRVWGSNVGNWGTDVQLEDNAPGLRYAYIGFDDNDEPYLRHEGRIYADYNEAMRSRPAMIFYYGTAEDPIPLTANSLDEAPAITFTDRDGQVRDDITAEPELLYSDDDHENAVVYVMTNKRLGNGTLSATVNGETHSMSAKVGLPQFYFYTERAISFDSMLEDTVYASGQETVLWLMTEEGHENGTITELDIRSGDVKAELVERDDDPGYYDVKITIPATCRGELNFYIHVSADNGGWGNSFRLQDTAPGLYYNYAMRDSNGGYYEENNMESFRRQQLGYTCTMVLYYGSKANGSLTPITAADEDSIPEVSVIPVSGGNPAAEFYARDILDNGRVVYCLDPLTVGDCLLSYTVGGETYTMPVSVTLPTTGFYTSKDCTAETLVRNGKFDYTANGRTVYYQALDDGPDIVNFALSTENDTDYSNILSIRKLSDKCWAIDVAAGFTGTSDWIGFDVETEWDDGETDSFYTDLKLVSSASAVYTRDFWVGPDGPEQGDNPSDALELWPGDNLDLIFYYGTHNDLSPLMDYTLKPADDSLLAVEQVGTHKDKPVYRVTALRAADPNAPTETRLTLTLSNGTTYTYPITIHPLEAGALYHRMLEWDGNAEGYYLQEPGWLEDDPISIAPYMDMYAFALYYSPDGMTYQPVTGTVRTGTSFDAVAIKTDSDGKAVTGWYEMSPFDFGEGWLDATVNGKTYSLELETRMPFLAFYKDETLSEDSFRMYQLMGESPTAGTDGYPYFTTLYVQCDDPDFDFARYHKFQATRKQYDENGFQIGEVPVDSDNFKAEIRTIINGVMKVELYSKVGDLLVWMFGFDNIEDLSAENPWDTCNYGTYVNLLTPDADSTLFVNLDDSNGFTASKFLPEHLFEQAAELDSGVTVGSNSYPGTVNFDGGSVKNIMAELEKDQPVCIIMDHAPGTAPQDAAIDRFAKKNKDIITVVNLDLLSGGSPFGTTAQNGLGGTATVTYNCDLELADGTEVDIYYLDDNNNVVEKLTGTYSGGVLTFQTTHFSSFAVTVAGRNTLLTVPQAMLEQNNAQIFAAFYEDGAMVDLRPVPAGQELLDVADLADGLTYRFFCMDATHHTPLTQEFSDTI